LSYPTFSLSLSHPFSRRFCPYGKKRREEFKIGYVRVSKQEQDEALQIDTLKEAGCENMHILAYNEKVTVPRAVT
jgi:resolvase-like protein